MKKIILYFLPLILLLTACGAAESERAAELQTLYGGLQSYCAEVNIDIPREDETLHYTLSYTKDGQELIVRVLAPELLRGVTAHIDDGTLALEYDGVMLDAGMLGSGVSALSCVPLLLQAFPESYFDTQGEETLGQDNALRVSFETDCCGEMLHCVMYFSEENTPLYAEISGNEKIIAFAEFTNFTFGDILPTDV